MEPAELDDVGNSHVVRQASATEIETKAARNTSVKYYVTDNLKNEYPYNHHKPLDATQSKTFHFKCTYSPYLISLEI